MTLGGLVPRINDYTREWRRSRANTYIRKGRPNIVRLAAIDETLNALSSDSRVRSSTQGKGNSPRERAREKMKDGFREETSYTLEERRGDIGKIGDRSRLLPFPRRRSLANIFQSMGRYRVTRIPLITWNLEPHRTHATETMIIRTVQISPAAYISRRAI